MRIILHRIVSPIRAYKTRNWCIFLLLGYFLWRHFFFFYQYINWYRVSLDNYYYIAIFIIEIADADDVYGYCWYCALIDQSNFSSAKIFIHIYIYDMLNARDSIPEKKYYYYYYYECFLYTVIAARNLPCNSTRKICWILPHVHNIIYTMEYHTLRVRVYILRIEIAIKPIHKNAVVQSKLPKVKKNPV